MNRLAPWLLAALALAGCSKTSSRPSAKMSGPQGVAVYSGYGADQPDVLRPLVAVANTRGDDLRIIDAVTDRVLEGPTVVSALMVPTEPRPALIAAGSLHGGVADVNSLGPDLLVVAPHGQVWRPALGRYGAVIQRIVTWKPQTLVDPSPANGNALAGPLDLGGTIDLSTVLPNAALTSLLVVPVPERDGAGGWRPAPGRARILAGTTDEALVSIEVMRDPASTGGRIVFASPVGVALQVQPLGFGIVDLAVSQDGTRVYAGTLDPIPGPGGVLGVAEFDNTATPGAMPVRALSARLGTTQVAAVDVAPFVANDPTHPEVDTFGPAVPRVYAVLDPAACGRDTSTPCGIAAIDPVAGALAPDPAGELPFQLPIQVPGTVVDFAVAGIPATTETNTVFTGYIKFDPGSGAKGTTAIAGVASSSGGVYLVDLAHFSVGHGVNPLAGSNVTRIGISGFSEPTSGSAKLGVWWQPAAGTPSLLFDTAAGPAMVVTPGYTPTDTFTLTWQGDLPWLTLRRAVAHVTSGAPTWIAVQEATGLTGTGTSKWRSVGRLYDPRAAVQPGDLVVVSGLPAGCAAGSTFELTVTALLPPDPVLYPGGALAVTPSAVQPAGGDPGCLPQYADTAVAITVKSSGLVLVGSATGYAGRPPIVKTLPDGTPEPAPLFALRYEDERLLSCPIMPDDPNAWPPAAADVAACQADVATCRSTCERLLLARKARRSFYVTDVCPPSTTLAGLACEQKWVTEAGLTFPNPRGAALAFKVGTNADPVSGKPALVRGAFLYFTTISAEVPTLRAPVVSAAGVGATSPYGVTMFDRTKATQNAADGIHGYAAFAYDLVLDFAPWAAHSNVTTIR